jgi:hypothetical protein
MTPRQAILSRHDQMEFLMKTLVLAALGSAMIAGCSKAPTNEWVVGNWTYESSSCDSGEGMQFTKEGTWAEEGSEGTWKLDGNTIIVKITGNYDDQGSLVPDGQLDHYVITKFDQNSFTSTDRGGQNPVAMKRCPATSLEPPSVQPTEADSIALAEDAYSPMPKSAKSCMARAKRTARAVNEDGTDRPCEGAECSSKKGGAAFQVSQIWGDQQGNVTAMCEKGGYCYRPTDLSMSGDCNSVPFYDFNE